MPQSLAQIYVHLVFATKNRIACLPPSLHEDVAAYLGGILRNHQCPSIAISCEPEHVHILYVQSKNHSLVDIVEEVKKTSSKWLKTKDKNLTTFYWQAGYGAFSVSASRLKAVERYIRNQRTHHRKITFQDEFRRFLVEYGIEYDERYVWD